MESSHTSIEINVISADGLRVAGHCFSKRDIFVTVRTGSRVHESESTDFADRVDGRGCSHYWNQQLKLPLPPLAPSISLEVCRLRTTTVWRTVAAVTVPLSDFAGFGPDGHLHHLSYRLRDERGRPNGILNFSVRVFGMHGVKSESCRRRRCVALDSDMYARRRSSWLMSSFADSFPQNKIV